MSEESEESVIEILQAKRAERADRCMQRIQDVLTEERCSMQWHEQRVNGNLVGGQLIVQPLD